MSALSYDFLANRDVPSNESIIARCREVGFIVSGTTLLKPSSKEIIAWVKYGPNVTISEALTQDWTAKTLDRTPACGLKVPRVYHAFTRETASGTKIGYIVMEYIDAPDCDPSQVGEVSKAVRTLINLPAASACLGHIGGRSIVHSFFPDFIPIVDYKSAQDLNDHINNILEFKGDSRRVDIATEPLCLHPCDIHLRNFKRRADGLLFALDFRATCFMPRSLLGVAMRKLPEDFGRAVAKEINDLWPDNVSPLLAASNFLVQFGQNPVALPRGLKLLPVGGAV